MDDERLGQIERRLSDLDRRESATERALERAAPTAVRDLNVPALG